MAALAGALCKRVWKLRSLAVGASSSPLSSYRDWSTVPSRRSSTGAAQPASRRPPASGRARTLTPAESSVTTPTPVERGAMFDRPSDKRPVDLKYTKGGPPANSFEGSLARERGIATVNRVSAMRTRTIDALAGAEELHDVTARIQSVAQRFVNPIPLSRLLCQLQRSVFWAPVAETTKGRLIAIEISQRQEREALRVPEEEGDVQELCVVYR